MDRKQNTAKCAAWREANREHYNTYQRNYRNKAKKQRDYERRCREIRASLHGTPEARV